MPVLQDYRREEIAALLESSGVRRIRGNSLGSPAAAGEYLTGSTLTFNEAGQLGPRYAVATLVGQLRELTRRGTISTEEANAYFASIYGYVGLFTSIPTSRSQRAAQATEVDLIEQQQTLGDVAQVVSSEQAAVQAATGTGGLQPVQIGLDQLPQTYNPDALAQVMRSSLDEIEVRLGELRAGKIAFAPGSLDGSVLRAGTVASTKLRADDLSGKVQQWPTEFEALEVSIDHDPSVDRWVDSGSLAFAGGSRNVRGPGRVWRARQLRLPPNYRRPTGGPMRYRLVTPGMEFGLMSITRIDDGTVEASDPAATYHLAYGIVVRGIRYFGDEPPSHIAALWVGAHPAECESQSGSPPFTAGTPQLFNGAARLVYDTGGYSLLAPFNRLSSSSRAPTAAHIDGHSGFRFGLITGQDWREVFPQLNGRPNAYGQLTGSPGPRLASTSQRVGPLSVEDEAPCPASVLTGLGAGPMVATYAADTIAGTTETVIQGVPFRPQDCRALAPDRGAKTFSVLIEPRLDRIVDGTQMGTWVGATTRDMRVGAWWTSGVRVVPVGLRRTLIDIVVW